MTSFSVDIDGRAFCDGFARLAAAVDDLTPIMDEIGETLITSVRLRFERSYGPARFPWEPSRKPRGKTLILRGHLRDSVTHQPTSTSVMVGTNLEYAAIHQFGGEIQRPDRDVTIYRHHNAKKNELSPRFVKKSKANFASTHRAKADTITMPARPYLGIDKEDEHLILTIFEENLMRAAT